MMRNEFNKAGFVSKAGQLTAAFLRRSPCLILAGLAVGAYSFEQQYARRGQIPLGFSEIGQTQLYVEKINHLKVPPLTNFYAVLNDFLMKIFEPYNISVNSWFGGDKEFAFELEKQVEPTMRIHHQIPEYANLLPGYADAALESLKKLRDANAEDQLPAVVKALDDSWDESHVDVERTVTTTTTECDSKGKNCRTITQTHQEYDHTVHTYRYDAAQGRLASRLSLAFIANYPDLHIGEKLFPAWQTNAENEWAIRESRRQSDPLHYKAPTAACYLEIANTWATGSNFQALLPEIEASNTGLSRISPIWDKAKDTAHSVRYTTYSHYDRGPAEYQVAMTALKNARTISDDISRTIGGIEHAKTEAPLLARKIQDFVNISLHGAPGNADRLGAEILKEAKKLYTENYAAGFNPYPSDWLFASMMTVLGMAGGAGMDYGIRRFNQSRRRREGLDAA